MVLRELELELTEDRPHTCVTKEPMPWTAPIKNPHYKLTCHPFVARFAARHLVILATSMCMYKCTREKNLIAVGYAGNAAAPPGGSRSISVATREKNLSVARFVEKASHRWLT